MASQRVLMAVFTQAVFRAAHAPSRAAIGAPVNRLGDFRGINAGYRWRNVAARRVRSPEATLSNKC